MLPSNFCSLFTVCKRFRCIGSIWTYFYDFSRDVAMATNYVARSHTHFICRTGILKRNGIYRYVNGALTASVVHSFTSCNNLRELWSSNSRDDRAHLWTFGTTRQKSVYPAEHLRIHWTKFSWLADIWTAIINLMFILLSSGTLLW